MHATLHEGSAPLQLTWAGSELRLPAALGATSGEGLSIYIAADGRYEFPGSEIPYARHTFQGETQFMTRNVLAAMEPASPDDDPVAVKIPGDPEFQESHVVEKEKRVPVYDCGVDVGCGCGDCNAGGVRLDVGAIALVVALVLRPRRRKRATSSR